MRLMRLVLIVCVVLGAALDASASKEGVLVWSSFFVHSAGIGGSGPVDVSGNYAAAGVTRLDIKAFGRQFSLTSDQLKQLEGVYVNGMQLSYEAGYEKTGGRTVYLLLSMGFTSGATEKRRIMLNERGDVTITRGKAAEQ